MPEIMIDEPLRRGLNPEERASVNAGALERCFGARPALSGLSSEKTITWPVAGESPGFGTNYHQFFRSSRHTLLASNSLICNLSTTEFPWTNAGSIYFGSEVASAGGFWNFLDMGDAWALMNEQQCLYLNQGVYGRVAASTVRVGCNHLGRVLWNNANAWASDWKAFWDDSAALAPEGMSFSMSSDYNTVFWSSPGSAEFLWMQLKAASGWTASADTVKNLWKRNDFGWLTLPTPSIILAMVPLGNQVIAYTTEGIWAVQLDSQTSSYGAKKVAGMGIPYRGAVAGDNNGHAFVDTAGVLWYLAPNLELARHGYDTHISPLLNYETIVTMDPQSRDTFIANKSAAYCMTGKGAFFESLYRPSSLLFLEGGICGNAAKATSDITVQTGFYDGNTRALKNVAGVEIGSRTPSAFGVYLVCRNTGAGTEQTVGPVYPGENGYAPIAGSGVEFSVKLTCAFDTAVDIDWIKIHAASGVRVAGGML